MFEVVYVWGEGAAVAMMGLAAVVKPTEWLARWPTTATTLVKPMDANAQFTMSMWGLSSFAFGAAMFTLLPKANRDTRKTVLQALLVGDVMHLALLHRFDKLASNETRQQAVASAVYLLSRLAFLSGLLDVSS